MEKVKGNSRYRKLVAGLFIPAVVLLFSSGFGWAAEYVSVKMYPEHIGVFTTVGTQQFVAFGIEANGNVTNITDSVSWASSDKNIVTIDKNGLATIVSGVTSGQVKITCTYPKTGGGIGPAVNQLLLK